MISDSDISVISDSDISVISDSDISVISDSDQFCDFGIQIYLGSGRLDSDNLSDISVI